MYKNFLHIVFLFFFALLFVACDNVFEFSPYSAKVQEEDKDQTVKSIGELYVNSVAKNKAITFITIADSHYDYYELKQAIEKINTLENIDFVVHLGDMTDKGLLMEYELFSEYVRVLNIPLLTCVGNHDYLSNGGIVYKEMFGAYNYSIVYNNKKLVFFDACTFESRKQPDFDWFDEQLTIDTLPKIIFSHIPPWDDQYLPHDTKIYKDLVEEQNVLLSMHGHHHNYFYGSPLNTEMQFLIPGSVKKGSLCKVRIADDNSYSFEMIAF